MNKATPGFLALLLLLSLPAMTALAASPVGTNEASDPVLRQVSTSQTTPTEVDGTTNRLQIAGDVRSETTAYRSDFGTMLANADDELRIDHEQYTVVDDGFDDATTEERERLIRTAYKRLMERADQLEQREREAVREHAAGERSTAELLQTLLRNYNEAEQLSNSLTELEARAAEVTGYSLPASRADVKTFNAHRTPVRDQLEQRSERPSDNYHDVVISTSQTGYSLSVMDGSRYLVETTRFDNRDKTASAQFENREAFDHTMELYPWAGEHGKPYYQDNSPDHYWTEFVLGQDRLEIYLDSGTGSVYREIQELSVSSLPEETAGTWTNDGLSIAVNETPANGPIEVSVTETGTDDPAPATISINGDVVGETGEDGTLWIVPPAGDYEVTAETGNRYISTTRIGS
ncbi:hypothetical protein C478_01305 [Natrinema thermotolerans DSM 11552]|nr:hypothetical protein C478_01305 [Natrinema thermotolerans DSM 11552]